VKVTRPALAVLGGLACLGAGLPAASAQQAVPIPNYSNLATAPVQSLEAMRYEGVVRQQHDLSCGAAALATLFKHYYGDPVSEAELIEDAIRIGDAEKIRNTGFSMLELKRVGEQRGYVVEAYRILNVDALRKVDVPLLTLVSTRGYEHFVLIKAVVGNRVLLADPAYGNRTLSVEQFEAEWGQVIMAFLSPTRQGREEFRLDTYNEPLAPSDEVMSLLDRPFVVIGREPGQF
jgi:uncharacterized protein